jgi:hypothetical protein
MRNRRIAFDAQELVKVLKDMEQKGFILRRIENVVNPVSLAVSYRIIYE